MRASLESLDCWIAGTRREMEVLKLIGEGMANKENAFLGRRPHAGLTTAAPSGTREAR